MISVNNLKIRFTFAVVAAFAMTSIIVIGISSAASGVGSKPSELRGDVSAAPTSSIGGGAALYGANRSIIMSEIQ